MPRNNIFDNINEKADIDYQIIKIENLLSESSIGNWTLEDTIDEYCLSDWKARGRCISCQEIRERLEITNFNIKHKLKGNQILNYLEYVANLIWLCNSKYLCGNNEFDDEYTYLQENVLGLLEDLGYEAKVFEDEEKVLLFEKNAAATAVAEIASPDIAYGIIEYNHYLLKGKIDEKRKILLSLADKFEPTKKELSKFDATLESNIGYLLNKMNIRHNNKEGKAASGYVATITDEELEEWYNETYQMLLLAMLELDNVDRNKRVAELKKKIEG